jgi:hypothetical protein
VGFGNELFNGTRFLDTCSNYTWYERGKRPTRKPYGHRHGLYRPTTLQAMRCQWEGSHVKKVADTCGQENKPSRGLQ